MLWLDFPVTVLASLMGMAIFFFLMLRHRVGDMGNALFVGALTGLSLSHLSLYLHQFMYGAGACDEFNQFVTALVIPSFLAGAVFVSAYTARRRTSIMKWLLIGGMLSYVFMFFGENSCSSCALDVDAGTSSDPEDYGVLCLGSIDVPVLMVVGIYALITRLRHSTHSLKHWMRTHMVSFVLIGTFAFTMTGATGGLVSASLFLSVEYVLRKPAVTTTLSTVDNGKEMVTLNEEEIEHEVAAKKHHAAASGFLAMSMEYVHSRALRALGRVKRSVKSGVRRGLRVVKRSKASLSASKRRLAGPIKRNVVSKRAFRRTRQVDGSEKIEEIVVDANGKPVELVLENQEGEHFVEPVAQSGPIQEVEVNNAGEVVGVDVPEIMTNESEMAMTTTTVDGKVHCPPCVIGGQGGMLVREELKDGISIIETEIPEQPIEHSTIVADENALNNVEAFPAALEEMLCIPLNARSLHKRGLRHRTIRTIRTGRGNRSRAMFEKMLCYKPATEHPENLIVNPVEEAFVTKEEELEKLEEAQLERMEQEADISAAAEEVKEEGLEGEKLADEIEVVDVVGNPEQKEVIFPDGETVIVPNGSEIKITEQDGAPTDTVEIIEPTGVVEVFEVTKPESEVVEEQSIAEKILDVINTPLTFFTGPALEPVSANLEGYTTFVNGVECGANCEITHVPNTALSRSIKRNTRSRRSLKRHNRGSLKRNTTSRRRVVGRSIRRF